MGLPDITTALESPLRTFHEAMTAQLGLSFAPDIVKAHSAEVTPGTVQRYVNNKAAVWPVIASADGIEDSPPTNLRMDVRWGVFIVAAPLHEVPDDQDPDRKVTVPAVMVAETLANHVVRLAYESTWGLTEGVNRPLPGSLTIRNLGVGVKQAQEFVEREDLGLFVVWGTHAVDMGSSMLPGDEQLPGLDVLTGKIKELCQPDVQPEIDFNLPQQFSALVGRAKAWLEGVLAPRPDWPVLAARAINDEMHKELAHAR
jgi:hypothetical protein